MPLREMNREQVWLLPPTLDELVHPKRLEPSIRTEMPIAKDGHLALWSGFMPTAADYGALGAVTEALPAGFACVSSGLDDEEVQATGQHVRFTRQGDSPSRYIVNAPSEEGAYSSSGMLRDSDRKDTPIGGASWGRATVQ